MEAILFKDGLEQKRAKYPRKDIGVIESLAPGLEWKLIVNTPPGAYDSRTEAIVKIEDNSEDAHPTYPHLKQFKISYNIVAKTNAQIIATIEELERQANERVVAVKNRYKYIVLGLGIVIKLIRDNTAFTAGVKQEAVLDKVMLKAVNIWANDTALQSKIQDVIDGNPLDLDSDWVEAEE